MNSHRVIAVFPGSFDPLTSGHVDIIERALRVFDEIIVGVLANPQKEALFTPSERVSIIEEQFSRMSGRVRAQSFSGLLVEFATGVGASVIIRGLRAISDYDYEVQMALMNRKLNAEIETCFLPSSERFSYVSSTIVKQVAKLGGDVRTFVPPATLRKLQEKFAAAG